MAPSRAVRIAFSSAVLPAGVQAPDTRFHGHAIATPRPTDMITTLFMIHLL
jgi:hypothetical protein